ncbi:hypothetical protein [Polyangium sp. 6x1]|uniref:hypothetical protein n=1 Tax=Polyangium sp. 6x1 TaxID=3042689 RepID=UPI0024826BB4|nr:hypothetical protein [Polyangium sp. 6x1]MDI1444234.1 hypothetical protein [Polyangium sp. 6x1]
MALIDKIKRSKKAPCDATSTITGGVGGGPTKALSIAIRDVGTPAQRVVDLRTVPWEVIVTYRFIEALTTQLRPLPPATTVTWVFDAKAGKLIDAQTPAAHAVLWPRFVRLAPSAVHVVYVDGVVLESAASGALEACGVSVAIRPPIVLTFEDGAVRSRTSPKS